jgi:PTS system cellobiose-specific IIC component
MPDSVPPAVAKSFTALIPAFVVVLVMLTLRLVVESTDFGNVHDVIKVILAKPLGLLGGSLIGSIVIMGLVSLLWSAGLHGMNIVGPVMNPIWLGNTGENMEAFKAGEAVPHIFTAEFFQSFVNLGGSGATFMLVVAMILFAKSQQMKQLGKLSAGPGVFMINEPVVFGTPIVLNPLLIIPFFLVPIANVILNYFMMDLGLVAKPAGIAIPWTTPPVIAGYLATGGHVSGAVANLVTLAMDFFIYLPFFLIWDKMKKKEEDQFAQEVAQTEQA